jgi:RTX calcium-binding nonapeptide repeat (4 copies)
LNESYNRDAPIAAISLASVIALLIVFVGVFPVMINFSNAHSSHSSNVGTTNLRDLGDRIKGLQPPSTSVKFGNTITCAPLAPCFGTNNDDIIFPGAGELVFARGGNDIVFGAINDQVYGANGNDIITLGAGHSLAAGGSGDDSLFGGFGSSILSGGRGNDKLFAGPVVTLMNGDGGANHFNCPLSVAGLARSIVLDYNPANGDTISGGCTLVNTVGNNQNNNNNTPNVNLPDTGDTTSSSGATGGVLGGIGG